MQFVSVALLAAFAVASTDYGFQCDQNHVINDFKTDNTLKCRLTIPPPSPVLVQFDSPFLKFNECSITLSDTEYVHIPVTPQIWSETEDVSAKIEFLLSSNCADEQSVVLQVKRKAKKYISAASTGDPHLFLTNDFETKVDFQGEGDYELFTHPQLQIQTHLSLCMFGNTCSDAITIRYGSSIMTVDMRSTQTAVMRYVTENELISYKAPSITGANDDSIEHVLDFPCGSTLKFTTYRRDSHAFINVYLFLAASYKDYGGMFNRADVARGKFLKRNQELTSTALIFFNSWKVQNDNQLLSEKQSYKLPNDFIRFPDVHCKKPKLCVPAVPTSTEASTTMEKHTVADKTITVTEILTTTAEDGAGLSGSTTDPGPQPTSAAGENNTNAAAQPTSSAGDANGGGANAPPTSTNPPAITSAHTRNGIATTTVFTTLYVQPGRATTSASGPLQTPMVHPPGFVANVTKHCTEIFVNPGCNKILRPQGGISACISDALHTGGYTWTDSHRVVYMSLCHTILDLMTCGSNEQVVQQALDAQHAAGLGSNPCLNSCSGHGKCSASGCSCGAGYSGMDCSTNLTPLLAFNPTLNAYVTNNPASSFPSCGATSDASPASGGHANPAPGDASSPMDASLPASGDASKPAPGDLAIVSSAQGYSVALAVLGVVLLML